MAGAETKCIGLVGGLGVAATIHYYQALAASFGGMSRELRLIVSHAEVSRVFGFVRAEDNEGLAAYLAGHLDALVRGGADMTTIGAVTPYVCANELAPRWQTPRVDLIEEIKCEIQRRAVTRVAVLGSTITMKTDLFGRLTGVKVARLDEDDMAFVGASYGRLAQTGDPSGFDADRVREIAHRLVDQQGVEAILLAGTELALIFDETNAGFPALDCAAAHMRAIVRHALGPVST